MALKITLKSNERIITGGSVLRNISGRNIEIALENEMPLLREKDILSDADADTPCKRIYLVLQLMYVDPANMAQYQKLFADLSSDVLGAAPSTGPIMEQIREEVRNNRLYQAMKQAKQLIAFEERVTGHVRSADRSL
jgi:flagellar biosynthesis repressor protein FlbT